MNKASCLDRLGAWGSTITRLHDQLELEPRDDSFQTFFNDTCHRIREEVNLLSREAVITNALSNRASSSQFLGIKDAIKELQGAVYDVRRTPDSTRALQRMEDNFRAVEKRICEVKLVLRGSADSWLQNPYSSSMGSRIPYGTLLAADFTNLLVADKVCRQHATEALAFGVTLNSA